ncbi:hypothetical protein PG996_002575 [Apiospora saccharicola]|uniref:Glutathione S-transferase n=1 Tax=Apiospora saccharicola TaxID=335842 RepID=A0ABR1WNW9_9PEZI
MPMPDANLHPVATGLAKETVDLDALTYRNSGQEHAAEQPLKLFAGWFCPFVQRVWLALEEKGIPYQYIEVNPYYKGEQLMKANPRGLVPTLEVAPGKALYESTVLLQYLEETYPHRAPRLLPPVAGDEGNVVQDHEAVFTRARARIWMDFVTTRVIPAWHRLLQFQAGTQRGNQDNSKKMLEGKRDEYRGYLLEFARAMDPEGPFFFAGDEIGMVDIAIAPWVLRHWVFDHFKGVTAVPEPEQAAGEKEDDEAAWARFRKWRAAVESRDSVKRTESEREHYLPIYQRYADDTAQSEMAKASRSGRGVP